MSTIAQQVRNAGKHTIGIGELAVSGRSGEVLITYALGSCLGVCIHDAVAGVGGILHAQLPTASADDPRARDTPARFVNTGVPALFKAAYALGAQKERIVLSVAGGAAMTASGSQDGFQIGKRNMVSLKKILWRNGVILRDCDVGGSLSRTISMDVATGEVRVKSGQDEYCLTRRYPREPERGS